MEFCVQHLEHQIEECPRPESPLPFLLPVQLDLGIPAMTKCCNQLDTCYDTCGANKYRCDAKFRWCLHAICSDLKRSLGFVSKVEGEFSIQAGNMSVNTFSRDGQLSQQWQQGPLGPTPRGLAQVSCLERRQVKLFPASWLLFFQIGQY